MWPYPKILAHRGGGVLAPENTLAALRCGLAHGFHAVEIDVMLSRDEVPVLMHDPDFGRTIAGSGQVAHTDAADLMQMDAGRWFGQAFAGENVPSLAQVLNFCQQNRIWMNIEIKPAWGFERRTGERVAEQTLAWFRNVPPEQWPLLSSFSVDALQAAQLAAPVLPRALLLDQIPPNWLEQVRRLQAVALHTNQKHLTHRQAQAVKEVGLGLFCYTVNESERADQLLAMGVDAFCTDRIDLMGPAYPL